MNIGRHEIPVATVLAPMAGVTDRSFRRICRSFGAGLTVGEMVAGDERLRESATTRERFETDSLEKLPVVQLLGSDPEVMADAARHAEKCGAAIVDINFGCPARVVCGKACGSAIMQDEELAGKIMRSVAEAVSVPVTVKMRTGWDGEHRNAPLIAKMAEDAGLAAVTVHGRTRADKFLGNAEYDTIAKVVETVGIPVIANGDITDAQKALKVINHTKAAGVMIGRGAYGNPWIFEQVAAALEGRSIPGIPDREEVLAVAVRHAREHFGHRGGTVQAVRMFRKHARWYMNRFEDVAASKEAAAFVNIDDPLGIEEGLIRAFGIR